MTNNEADKKCGLCGNLLKDCHPACTETYSSDLYKDERGPTILEYQEIDRRVLADEARAILKEVAKRKAQEAAKATLEGKL